MVYSHWLTPGPRPRPGPGQVFCRTFHIAPGPGQGPGRMACIVWRGAFHTALGPGQGQGPGKTLLSYDPSGLGTFSGPEKMGIAPICVFPSPCACPGPGAVWKAPLQTIQAILPGPGPRVKQCEYTFTVNECDWHILAGNDERINSHCLTCVFTIDEPTSHGQAPPDIFTLV